MKNKITVSAKTYDEAVTKAKIELQSTEEHLKIEVVEEGSNGFFGLIGSRPWTIVATLKTEEEEAAEQKAKEEAERKAASEKAAAEREAKKKADAERKAAAEKEAAGKKAAAEKEAAERKAAAEKAAAERKAQEERKAAERKPEAAEAGSAEKSENPAEKSQNQKETAERRRRKSGLRQGGRQEEKRERPVRRQREETVGREVLQEEADEIKEKAASFLQELFRIMGEEISIDTDFNYQDNELSVMMSGDHMGALIGKRGQTLDSLQYLVSLVVNKHRDVYIRVKLDTENYRERREQKLKSLARNIAHKVKKTRKPVALEPMNPYERRIIHSALQRDPYVTTYSEGDDPFRHIVVVLKKDPGRRRPRGAYQNAGADSLKNQDEITDRNPEVSPEETGAPDTE